MRLLPLAKSDLVALIDEGDYTLVCGYRWTCYANGYVSAKVRTRGVQRNVYLHRLLVSPPPGFEVDHINGDKLDNRRANIRVASRSQNCANKSKRRDNTSGAKGVTWHTGRWVAQIGVRGRQVYLGRYPSVTEAAAAYDVAAEKYFGVFAKLNQEEVK